MINKKYCLHKILSWLIVILWMIVIFNLSSQAAEQSNELSTGFSQFIIDTIESIVPEQNIDTSAFNSTIRDIAHFVAYLVLGITVINAIPRNKSFDKRSVALALLICILFAISDEIHQLFVSGRGAQVVDVVIDSAGASGGIGLFLLLIRLFTRKDFWENK